MIQPSKNYILVEEFKEEEISTGLVRPESAKDRPIKARVVAVGEGIDLEEGDVIYHHKWDVMDFEDNGKKLKFLKSDAILGKEIDG